MWSHCYRKHVIMPFPSFDTATNSWAPQADISWPTGPERKSEFVRFPIRVMTESEAVACALRKGKSWIDRRLKQADNADGRHLAMENIARLQDHLRQTNPMPVTRISVATPKQFTDSFSFSEFKSSMAKCGAAFSEESLRKSYNSLMKLRANGNCSLAEIRSKVKRSQEILAGSRGVRHDRATRLPVTQRDWQSIN